MYIKGILFVGLLYLNYLLDGNIGYICTHAGFLLFLRVHLGSSVYVVQSIYCKAACLSRPTSVCRLLLFNQYFFSLCIRMSRFLISYPATPGSTRVLTPSAATQRSGSSQQLLLPYSTCVGSGPHPFVRSRQHSTFLLRRLLVHQFRSTGNCVPLGRWAIFVTFIKINCFLIESDAHLFIFLLSTAAIPTHAPT